MIKYKIKGEEVPDDITGAKSLVLYMHLSAENPSSDINSYMLDYSKRSVLYRNIDIRATDEESFVEDLIRHGDVQVVE